MTSMDWKTLSLLVTLVITWSGLIIGIIKWMLDKYLSLYHAHIDQRFESLEGAIREKDNKWQHAEREIMELRAELPLEYMRKEDAIRQEIVIHAKLDALASKMDELMVKGERHG